MPSLHDPTSPPTRFTMTQLLFDYSLLNYTIDKPQGILYAVQHQASCTITCSGLTGTPQKGISLIFLHKQRGKSLLTSCSLGTWFPFSKIIKLLWRRTNLRTESDRPRRSKTQFSWPLASEDGRTLLRQAHSATQLTNAFKVSGLTPEYFNLSSPLGNLRDP
jgi:hypothetical protein